MQIRHNDDDEDDHMDLVRDVNISPPPAPSVVALLPRTDPQGPIPPIPLEHQHQNPMLVSLVPITFGSSPDLMGTGSSQIVNVRPNLSFSLWIYDGLTTDPF
jgi:hypothetical protein